MHRKNLLDCALRHKSRQEIPSWNEPVCQTDNSVVLCFFFLDKEGRVGPGREPNMQGVMWCDQSARPTLTSSDVKIRPWHVRLGPTV